jgi:hypothetical protein
MNTSTLIRPKQKPSVRDGMEAIARALKVELGRAPDAGIAVVINERMGVNIAPGLDQQITAFFQIAEANQVSSKVWISALSEAASWGLDGDAPRFVVLNRHLTLLWTTPARTEEDLLARLHEKIAVALALSDLVKNHPA